MLVDLLLVGLAFVAARSIRIYLRTRMLSHMLVGVGLAIVGGAGFLMRHVLEGETLAAWVCLIVGYLVFQTSRIGFATWDSGREDELNRRSSFLQKLFGNVDVGPRDIEREPVFLSRTTAAAWGAAYLLVALAFLAWGLSRHLGYLLVSATFLVQGIVILAGLFPRQNR